MSRPGFNFSMTTLVVMLIGLATVAVILSLVSNGFSGAESFGSDQINISTGVF
ncbi:MAG: hypothetical protein ACI977_000048 [Candidatus Nanohaloarchaea archaeon]|jgi:hypothetical protein